MAELKKYCKQRVNGMLDSRAIKVRTCIKSIYKTKVEKCGCRWKGQFKNLQNSGSL